MRALSPLLLAASTRALAVRRITVKMSAMSTRGVLLTKAGKDGVSLGDCPFTQYAAMSMELAGATYSVRPTAQAQKPAWHVDAHGGSMPCWAPNGADDGAGAIADSGAIAQGFLPPSPADTAVLEICGGLFGGIARYVKNADAAKDSELLEGLTEQLDKLQNCLGLCEQLRGDGAGPYLSGAAPGLADAFVAPKLYVLFVAGGHFKGFSQTERHPKVASYWAAISAHEAFCKTRYPEAEMLHGWAEARGEVESEGPGCAIEW